MRWKHTPVAASHTQMHRSWPPVTMRRPPPSAVHTAAYTTPTCPLRAGKHFGWHECGVRRPLGPWAETRVACRRRTPSLFLSRSRTYRSVRVTSPLPMSQTLAVPSEDALTSREKSVLRHKSRTGRDLRGVVTS
jgi:hypothetical protein